MLRITARESRRARTRPARSPFTRVSPALSMATSVPLPMAIPTSAAARAGASLMPSPAKATRRPFRRQAAARLDRVPDLEEAGGPAVHRHQHGGGAVGPHALGLGRERARVQAQLV